MIVQYVLFFTALLAALLLGRTVYGALRYDVKHIQRQRQILSQAHSKKFRRRPLVSVLVAAQNDQDSIVECLDSISKGRYRKLEIIVADNNSQDQTKKIVRQYMREHPKTKIRLVARRTTKTYHENVASAAKVYANGELTVICSASDRFDIFAIKQAVMRFLADTNVQIVAMHSSIVTLPVLVNLLQRYKSLMHQRDYKAHEYYNRLGVSGQTALCVKSEIIKRPKQQIVMSGTIVYASDAVVLQRLKPSYSQLFGVNKSGTVMPALATSTDENEAHVQLKKLLQAARTCITTAGLVIAPGVIAYCAYLALSLHQPTLLEAVLLYYLAFMMHAILNDTTATMVAKLRYFIGLPLTCLFGFLGLVSIGLRRLYSYSHFLQMPSRFALRTS